MTIFYKARREPFPTASPPYPCGRGGPNVLLSAKSVMAKRRRQPETTTWVCFMINTFFAFLYLHNSPSKKPSLAFSTPVWQSTASPNLTNCLDFSSPAQFGDTALCRTRPVFQRADKRAPPPWRPTSFLQAAALACLCLVLTGLTALPAGATVGSRLLKSFALQGAPLDVAVSPDGTWTFVLGKDGKVAIYNADGELNDTLQVAKGATAIALQGKRGERLLVTSDAPPRLTIYKLRFAAQIDTTGSPFLGNPNAPVTVALFSDFQCPYCAKMQGTVAKLLATYPEEIKVVFKHFPLRMHRYAGLAALAAIAAQQEGKFWQFHDRLFAAQKELNQQKILAIAKDLGLDEKRFIAAIGSKEVKERLAKDMAEGKKAGVTGTPTVFVNGREPDKPSFAAIKKLIDAELAKKK